MSLYTDGPIAKLADLQAYESSILDVATTEGIELGAKLEIAQREIGLELAAFLLRRGVSLGPYRELTNVVATEPLLHVHALHTLGLIYRDAYNSQLNDRYLGKWKEYAQLAERAFRQLLQVGVGISNGPIPKAASPELGSVPGGTLPVSNYVIRTTWVNGYGVTGALSDPTAMTVEAEKLLTVTAGSAPAGVVGFHVLAVDEDGRTLRQSTTPVPIGQAWILPSTGIRSDLPGATVQRPDYYLTERREWQRG